MTNNLNQIVEVAIRVETPVLSPAGFGRAAIVGNHSRFAERYRLYSGSGGLEAMIADGFLATDAEYIEAAALVGQSGQSGRRVQDFVVGRRETAVAQVSRVTVVYAVGVDYTMTFSFPDRPDVTVVVSAIADQATTEAAINTALNAAINGLNGLVSSTDQVGYNEITSDRVGVPFTIAVSATLGGTITTSTTTANVGIQEDLAAIVAAGAEFYGVVLTSRDETEIVMAAYWAESATPDRFLFWQSNEAALLAADYDPLLPYADIGSQLKAASLTKNHGQYRASDSNPIAAMLAGYVLPFTPGTINWANKTLVGGLPDDLSATQIARLCGTKAAPTTGKNVNIYIPLNGQTNRTLRGLTPSGQFADVTRAVAYIGNLLETALANLQLSATKIPFDQSGLDQIEATIRSTLEPLKASGVLASDREIVVNVPLSRDVSATDRAARNLTGITFTAVLSGALNGVTVNGTVS